MLQAHLEWMVVSPSETWSETNEYHDLVGDIPMKTALFSADF
jgi:hypothetical protein